MVGEIEELKELKDKLGEDFVTKQEVQEMHSLIDQDLKKMDNPLKERLRIVEEQISHLNRQLISEK